MKWYDVWYLLEKNPGDGAVGHGDAGKWACGEMKWDQPREVKAGWWEQEGSCAMLSTFYKCLKCSFKKLKNRKKKKRFLFHLVTLEENVSKWPPSAGWIKLIVWKVRWWIQRLKGRRGHGVTGCDYCYPRYQNTKLKAESGKNHSTLWYAGASMPPSETDCWLKTLLDFSSGSKSLRPSEVWLRALAGGEGCVPQCPHTWSSILSPFSLLCCMFLCATEVSQLWANSVVAMSTGGGEWQGVGSPGNTQQPLEAFALLTCIFTYAVRWVQEAHHPPKSYPSFKRHRKCHQIHRSFPRLLIRAVGPFLWFSQFFACRPFIICLSI